MISNKKIAVVVPAHNEADHIAEVIRSMPSFVDHIVIVDDYSSDQTVNIVTSMQASDAGDRCIILRHTYNQGVGAAIATGYRWANEHQVPVTTVMAGDGQMDPAELAHIIAPVVDGQAEYVKGNRLIYADVWNVMPKYRFLGNSFLSLLTKIASGYWKMVDSQTGYTAISLQTLQRIDLKALYPSYGFPNDLLVKLNVINARVVEIPIRPIYAGQKSGIRLSSVIPRISWLLLRGFVWRLWVKYVVRDFHPLVFFYSFGILFFSIGSLFGLYLVVYRLAAGPVSTTSALFASLFFISGLQSLFFAMWFDMEDNKELFIKRDDRR
ncbi:MAG: glycosyltransferase family 2 protein [Candidatus Kerfeldbacteria bacterium]|nr:glycosyltransferase family 2 protein [Candidatus Kerfeldbacteria bacterium]